MSRNNLNLLGKCKGARSKDRRVRAPNEPRIIVALPRRTPRLSSRDLFAICESNREGRSRPRPADSSLREYVRVFCEASASALCRFATPGDNRRTTRYRSRVSWDVDYACRVLKGSETLKKRCVCVDLNICRTISLARETGPWYLARKEGEKEREKGILN